MNIEEINRRHLFQTDKMYRMGFGLCSRLLDYRNGVIYLEVMFGRRWKKSYNTTAYEIAKTWKDGNKELSKAIGSKVFIIDARKNPYKKSMYFNGESVLHDGKKGLLFAKDILN